jgi:hypothetical protein
MPARVALAFKGRPVAADHFQVQRIRVPLLTGLGGRRAVWLAGAAMVWIGFVTHTTVLIAAGALASLSTWVNLGSRPTKYAAGVSEIVNRRSQAVSQATEEYQAALSAERTGLLALTVPPALAGVHERLMRTQPVAAQAPWAERAKAAIVRRNEVDSELAALGGGAPGAEQAYVARLQAWRTETMQAYSSLTAELERAASEAMAQVQLLRVPKALMEMHESFYRACADEYVAQAEFHRAAAHGDVTGALAAGARLHVAVDKLRGLMKTIQTMPATGWSIRLRRRRLIPPG